MTLFHASNNHSQILYPIEVLIILNMQLSLGCNRWLGPKAHHLGFATFIATLYMWTWGLIKFLNSNFFFFLTWNFIFSFFTCESFCCGQEGVTCLLWLGASQYIATGCVDGKVRVWDSLSGSCVRTFTGHSDAIQSLALSKNGDFLVSVSLDQTARVFETADLPNKWKVLLRCWTW